MSDLQAVVDVVSTVSVPLIAVGGLWLRDSIRKEITLQTRPIQANANGGFSLPDAIKEIKDTRTEVMAEVNRLHGRITDVATDVAHLKGRVDQQTWEGAERRHP